MADAAVDVIWNRQNTSIAFHTIAAPDDDPVDEDDVRAVVDSNSEPETGRSPSIVGIATTASFTESAVGLAEANDVELFGEPHIDTWFRHAGLSRRVAGPLLEENELTVEEIEDLLADLPPIPESAQLMDPLGDFQSESTSVTVTSKDVVPDVDTGIPVTDEPSPQGKKGELYADPGEDGDFGAFDRFVEGLDENEDPE
jgi:hypothetical protein